MMSPSHTAPEAQRSSSEPVIVGAVRTAIGKRGGGLSGVHPVDLSAAVLQALAERTGIEPKLVDDVVWGCVTQAGEQAGNIGRFAALAAGWPEEIPGTTVDRQCGSSQQAVHFAAAGVAAGHYDLVVAGGVESMSRIPMGWARINGPGEAFGPKVAARYGGAPFNQGVSADRIAKEAGFSREELDRFSLESHARAAAAEDAGLFQDEIVPVLAPDDHGRTELFARDEGIRREGTLESLGRLKPAFSNTGVVTAGNSSQISDGAAAIAITTAGTAARLGLRPRARLRSFALAAVDPMTMLTGPIPATEKVLRRAGLTINDIGVFEINEAFASVTCAWLAATGADRARLNPNGGAIALGHPLGGSGARIMTTLLHHMERESIRYGLQSMCEGGGTANATVLELCEN